MARCHRTEKFKHRGVYNCKMNYGTTHNHEQFVTLTGHVVLSRTTATVMAQRHITHRLVTAHKQSVFDTECLHKLNRLKECLHKLNRLKA